MPVFGSDQIRCSLLQDNSKNNSINYALTRLDGTIVNEIDIVILTAYSHINGFKEAMNGNQC